MLNQLKQVILKGCLALLDLFIERGIIDKHQKELQPLNRECKEKYRLNKKRQISC